MRQSENTKGPVSFEYRGFRFTVEEIPDLYLEGMEYALNIVNDLIEQADQNDDAKERECFIIASTMINTKIDEIKRNS